MTLKETIKADEPHFLNTDEFATVADFSGTLINGILDRGMEGDQEPRSPRFTCREDELTAIVHGAPVTIEGITYWLEGYRPDGYGMADLVLRKDP